MKKLLSLIIIGVLCFSTFSTFTPQVKAEEIVWNTNPTPLHVPLTEHASVVYDDKIYVIGGDSVDGKRRNTVYFADILPDGTVGTWMENPTPLPEVRADFEAVAWNGFVYVLGGSTTGGAYLNTVLYAQIQSDGTLGDWMTTTSLPTTVAGYASVVWNGRIYVVIGGWPGWKGEVHFAEINSDGSIGDWNPTSSLPQPRRAPAVAIRNDVIYVIGGQYPSTVYHSTVYNASVDSDGSIGAWSTTTSIPTNIQNAKAVLVDDDIYVVGGDDGYVILDTVFRPSVNPDGTIESWTQVEDNLPEPRTIHACVVSQRRIYVLGGAGTDSREDTIYYSSPIAPPEEPDFEISVSPVFQVVNPGESASYEISLIPLNGFDSEVSLFSGWIGDPPTTGSPSRILDPWRLTPPGISTFTLITSEFTQLGQFAIEIIAVSGSTTHSVNITIQVGFAVEIEIEKFRVLEDSDILDPFSWAQVYFRLSVPGVEGEIRIPPEGKEPSVGDEDSVGPLCIPDHLVRLPFNVGVYAYDKDPLLGDDMLGIFGFTVEELPSQYNGETSFIYLEVSVTEVRPRPFRIDCRTSDNDNEKQWYWHEVEADLVRQNFEEDSFDEVIVAVIDTGVNYSHPDLNDNMWTDSEGNHGFNYVDWGLPPMDEDGHGTSIAGIIAAETDNNEGIAGIASNVKIMALKIGRTRNKLDLTEIPSAILFAVNSGAKVICMSFGDYSMGGPLHLNKIRMAIENAYKSGVAVVAAAGNDMTSKAVFPASFKEVVSVSALQRYAVYYSESNGHYLGAAPYTYFRDYPEQASLTLLAHNGEANYGPSHDDAQTSIELCAPGYSIWTTDHKDYGPSGGTSSSAPIVSAVAAMVLGYAKKNYPHRVLTPNEVRYILRLSSDDLGPIDWDPYYGYGMVNACRALQKVDELLGRRHWRIRLDPPGNLDLHVYDMYGRHVGVNYETGQDEVEIPEVHYTGDETGGWETIFLPSDLTEFEIEVVNRDPPDPIEFSLSVMTFDDSGDLLMEETQYGSVQPNSEIAYLVSGTETGEFISYEISAYVDKFFKPGTIGAKRRGAVMSRIEITNTGYLDIEKMTFEDEILNGWVIKQIHTISATLLVDGEEYGIPYEELDDVALDNDRYVVSVNFTNGVDLYQYDPALEQEVYLMTVYAFEPEWILEIKYPMHPPRGLEAGDYDATVSVTITTPQDISLTVEDTETLNVT